MGRTHYIYMNGSSGCMPDTCDLCFSIDEAVGMFETIFGDDLYQNFNLAELVDDDVISAGVVYDKLERFFTKHDWQASKSEDYDEFIEGEFNFFLEEGYVKSYVNPDIIMEAIDEFGQLVRDLIVKDFRDSGYVNLGPDHGADYASWSPCDCDSPWEHSELSMEQWIREHGDVWFTESIKVRVRYQGDERPWENMEPFDCAVSERDEELVENMIMKAFVLHDRRRVLEVRWNWVYGEGDGPAQGHYFVPEYTEAA
jgi:hypothetical protein